MRLAVHITLARMLLVESRGRIRSPVGRVIGVAPLIAARVCRIVIIPPLNIMAAIWQMRRITPMMAAVIKISTAVVAISDIAIHVIHLRIIGVIVIAGIYKRSATGEQ